MDKRRVLVYDSGIGGLNVLITLEKEFPFVDFFYLSDLRNAPYGNKTIDELFSISKNNLTNADVDSFDAVVLACNTLSTNCYSKLCKCFPKTNFVKVEPQLNMITDNGVLLCTERTAKSEMVSSFKKLFGDKLIVKPLQDLVCEIEKNVFSLYKIDIDKYLGSVPKSVESLFIGCTHYCFLKNEILLKFPNARVYDGIKPAIDQLFKKLTLFNHINTFSGQKGCIYTIGEDAIRNEKIIEYMIKNRINS